MPVFHVKKTTDYTVMSNHHLRDKSLSLKAKGLLSQMLSLPEGYVSLVHKGSQKNDACNLTLFIHMDLLDNRPPKGSFLFLGQAVIETAEAFC